LRVENPFTFERGLVVNVVEEAPGVKTYTVRLGGGYAASPGQFNMIYIYGLGEVPVSISSLPRRHGGYVYVDHTIRVVGAVTRAIVARVAPGSVVGVRGPYGRGWPLREAEGRDLVVVAGGIGLAPLKPVIERVAAEREAYGRVNILYGARTPEQLLYKRELEGYAKIPNTKLLLSVDSAGSGWPHHVGFVTDLIDHVDVDVESAVAFICGPEVMMRVAVKKLLERGFKEDRVYVSLERRMRCGVGVCGTCQLGHYFVCRDGPVFSISELGEYFWVEGI
jgi:NAD(P)H-flavin reductase